MDNANLIACLYAADSDPLGCSHAAICSSDNQARYFPAQQKASNAFSRESTASLDSDEDSYQTLNHLFKPGLQLTFNPGPKSGAAVGFVVGTDAKSCDIIVPNLKGISARHCYFTFNAKRQFIVYDFSHNGSIVSYDGKLREKRRDFPWILSGDKALETTKIIVIQIHPHVRFQIVVPRQKTQLYCDNLDRFLKEAGADDGLRLGGLGIQSKILTAAQSGECTPSQNPLYLPQGELGKGSFGLVTRVWDVSAGIMRASKEFHNISKSNWRREASIMKRVSHPHIVELIRVLEMPSPRLILEYLPLGNLDDQNRKQRISEYENLRILRQGLNALNCLHEEGIVHRDIKPENILVQSRDRFSFHIKLSDFGLSKQTVL